MDTTHVHITCWQRRICPTATFFLLPCTGTMIDHYLISNAQTWTGLLTVTVCCHECVRQRVTVTFWPRPLFSHMNGLLLMRTNCCWQSHPHTNTHTHLCARMSFLDGFSEDTRHCCTENTPVCLLLGKMAVNQAGHRCLSPQFALGRCVRVCVCVCMRACVCVAGGGQRGIKIVTRENRLSL